MWFNKKEFFVNLFQFPTNLFKFGAKNCGDTTRFFIFFCLIFKYYTTAMY